MKKIANIKTFSLLLLATATIFIKTEKQSQKEKPFLTGFVKEEYVNLDRSVFLNAALPPDKYSFYKNTIELSAHLKSLLEEDSRIKGKITLRHKGVWGQAGSTTSTEAQPIRIDITTIGEHGHTLTQPILWLKESWIQIPLDGLINGLENKTSFIKGPNIKLGCFAFNVGRGLSLGTGYGTNKNFLALYDKINDFYAPGILIKTKLADKTLELDIYYAMLESRSASLRQTLNFAKTNQIGEEKTPWVGSGKDSQIYATQLFWKPNFFEGCTLTMNPYALYNIAKDQRVEVPFDSTSNLGTIGLAGELMLKTVEFGFEVAQNFGTETLANIDRNQLSMRRNANGTLENYFTKIIDGSGKQVVATTPLIAEISKNRHVEDSSYTTGFTAGGNTYYSSPNRVRPSYTNTYKGFCIVADALVKIPTYDCTIAAAVGYASGDANPHGKEVNKTYKGFVGLQEYYSGKRVKSIIMLDSRTVKRPLSFDETSSHLAEDPSFSDIIHVGTQTVFTPSRLKKYSFALSNAMLVFWKDHQSLGMKKNDNGDYVPSDELARRYLGVEYNTALTFKPYHHVKVDLVGACFIPGAYYSDIKGAPLANDFFNQLDLANKDELFVENYRIGNDFTYALNLIVTVNF